MATKTSKKEKSIKSVESETDHSSDEMETHSIWNGRFKRSSEDAKFFRDFLTDLNNEFIDQEGFEAILKHYWGDSIENLNKLITKQNKTIIYFILFQLHDIGNLTNLLQEVQKQAIYHTQILLKPPYNK